MSFWEQVSASPIGTFFAFVFAIVLFLVTLCLQRWWQRRAPRKHIVRESLYDISLLKRWIEEIDSLLTCVSADNPQVHTYLKYTDLQ